MEKQIYSFKFKKGSFDTLQLCSTEYPKIKQFWDSENKSDYPFADYTKDLINELKDIVKRKDELMAAVRGTNIIAELSNLHFTKELRLSHILNWCPNGERIQMLHKYMDKLTDKEYWEQLGLSYTTQEYNSVPDVFLKNMFTADRGDQKYLMNDEEHKLLESLSEFVTVYRGMSTKEAKSGKYRLSWTLDNEVAEKFVERNEMIYGTEMTIKELKLPKKDIIAVFLGRSEKEIIYIQ